MTRLIRNQTIFLFLCSALILISTDVSSTQENFANDPGEIDDDFSNSKDEILKGDLDVSDETSRPTKTTTTTQISTLPTTTIKSSELKVEDTSGFVTNSEESNEVEVEPGETTDKNDDKNQFSWLHHPEDHGIYRGRSLMFAATKNSKIAADEDEDKEISGDTKMSMRLSDATDDDSLNPLNTKDFVEKEWQLMFRSLDLMFHDFISTFSKVSQQTNFIEKVISGLSSECRRSIHFVRDSALRHKMWALRMLDSHGKLPSGITRGRFSSPGDYEECLSVQVDTRRVQSAKFGSHSRDDEHKFHGKYCLLDFRLPVPERPRDRLLSIHEPLLNLSNSETAQRFPEILNYSAYASVFYETGYMHAFCLPSTCQVRELTKSLTRALEGLHISVRNEIDCEERPADHVKPLRWSQIIAFVILAGVLMNALVASVAQQLIPQSIKSQSERLFVGDAGANRKLSTAAAIAAEQFRAELRRRARASSHSANWARQLIKWSARNKFYSDCFSLQKNFERLTKPDPRGLTFVHYTRIVAMGLTVITHTGAMGTLQAITKPADASNSESIFRDFIPQMLANAFTSIQIFFFMAGFMLVVSTYPSVVRDKGHLSFLEYSIKRAIRLLPGILATICLNFIWPLFVDGPMLSYFERVIVEPCEHNWWRTMSFISNFDNVEKMCLRHSYFSASDYQLHLMAFPLLILLYRQPVGALLIAGLLVVGGFVAQVIMVLTQLVMPFMMVDYIDKQAFFNVVHYIHHPVWNHMSAFFYGFIIGYLVVRQIRFNLSPTTIKRLWFTVVPLGIVSIFAPYYWNHYKRPIVRWQMIVYVLVDRFVLLTACAWLSYASMVLARKPRATQPKGATTSGESKPAVASTQNQPTNIPNIIINGDEQTEAKPKSHERLASRQETFVGLNGNILPRQRSSPNFQTIKEHESLNFEPIQRPLKKTISTSNLLASTETLATRSEVNAGGRDEAEKDEKPQAANEEQKNTEQKRAPVSNINTLCLVLSRLTFQLYLFNMLVLCVDVNHSKYLWFFSYYFIITKACAVYIVSAILAVIFFVTMESPALTLYIAWVKSKAMGRAEKQMSQAQSQVATEFTSTFGQKESSNFATADNRICHDLNSRRSPSTISRGSRRDADGTSFDGICMHATGPSRENSPSLTDKDPAASFAYIDLEKNVVTPGGALEQTRM